MKKIAFLPLRLVVIILGFLFYLFFPLMIAVHKNKISFGFENVKGFFEKYDAVRHMSRRELVEKMGILPSSIKVEDHNIFHILFESNIGDRIGYSLTIFILSLLFTILAGLLIAICVLLLSGKWRSRAKGFLNLTEAVPDLLVIFLFQFFVITLYKSTGIKFLQLYGTNAYPYFIPIVTVSFLPIFFMAQFLIKSFEEESDKQYVLLAKAKGLSNWDISFKHLLKNIFPYAIIHLRVIIWLILSNLLLVEYIFSIDGFTRSLFNQLIITGHHNYQYLTYDVDFVLLAISLFLFILPMIVIEFVIYLMKKKRLARGGQL
ncbi:ABC transporter permease subunit [Cytobacillus sp. Hz8]|uniref:ABC transporter permease subunit n=1 Tax=Cytobacillus sp. Hz8 TaxID=3347168 RepID=UPI0035D5D7F2